MKGLILYGNTSIVELRLENGIRLYADAKIHNMQMMLDSWAARFEIVKLC